MPMSSSPQSLHLAVCAVFLANLAMIANVLAQPTPGPSSAGSVSMKENVVVYTTPSQINKTSPSLDYVNAKPMKLPIAPNYSPLRESEDVTRALNLSKKNLASQQKRSLSINSAPSGAVGSGKKTPEVQVSRGATGSGTKNLENLGIPAKLSNGALDGGELPGASPMNFGTANLAFSSARADLSPGPTNDQYPYRATGKLFFLNDGGSFICSASLIKRGLVVTAAHCVSQFGKKKLFSDWEFIPGYRDGEAPYGRWNVAQAYVLRPYFEGGDSCAQKGVVCESDIAILALQPKQDANGSNFFAGDNAGWYAYAWDKAGFTPDGITHITQVGYPACLDNGGLMQRNDSHAVISSKNSSNTVIGSLMCGGSSGGPWLVNFGVRPELTGTLAGNYPETNVVIGVTSWGSTHAAVKNMGASPFSSKNIAVLVEQACKGHPEACK